MCSCRTPWPRKYASARAVASRCDRAGASLRSAPSCSPPACKKGPCCMRLGASAVGADSSPKAAAKSPCGDTSSSKAPSSALRTSAGVASHSCRTVRYIYSIASSSPSSKLPPAASLYKKVRAQLPVRLKNAVSCSASRSSTGKYSMHFSASSLSTRISDNSFCIS